jgi:hypothetical protein
MATTHAAGSYVYVAADDQFYQVGSTQIAQGGTLTPGTNATAKSVAEVLSALNGSVASITSDLAKNDLGTVVDISSYGISNKYTVPSDGYIECVGSASANLTVFIYGRSINSQKIVNVSIPSVASSTSLMTVSTYVKKGMVVAVYQPGTYVHFIPLE